jgi:hypothetical protein
MELNQMEVKEVVDVVEFATELATNELSDLQLTLVGGGCGVATFG